MSDPELRDDWCNTPLPSRLSPEHTRYVEIMRRHHESIESRLPTYLDPVSGFSVFTAKFLARRAYCCESGCRHCPYAV